MMPTLRYRQDRRTLVFTAMTLALQILPFFWSWPQSVPVVWIGLSAAFCFNACVINHNHAHLPVFTHGTANQLFSLLLTLLRGHSAGGVIAPHNLNHHRHHGSERDWIKPTLAGHGPGLLRLSRYVLYACANMARQRMQRDAPKPGASRRRQIRRERLLLLTYCLLMLAIDPQTTLLFLVLPWSIGVIFLVAVNLPQHEGCLATSRFNHSRNFVGGLGNWLLFNNGYHTAHHLNPQQHWSELAQAHNALRDKLSADQEHASLIHYMLRHYLFGALTEAGVLKQERG